MAKRERLTDPLPFVDPPRDDSLPTLRWPLDGETYAQYVERMYNRAIVAWWIWKRRAGAGAGERGE